MKQRTNIWTHKIVVGLVGISLALVNLNISYAAESNQSNVQNEAGFECSQEEEELHIRQHEVYIEEQKKAGPGDKPTTWIFENNKWKYLNEAGESTYGLFTDSHGDIYYGGEDGYIYQNKSDENYQYFGSDGRLINFGAALANSEETLEIARLIDKGEVVTVDKSFDVANFLEFYFGQHYKLSQNAMVAADRKDKNHIRLHLLNSPVYNEEEVEKSIYGLYNGGVLAGKTDYDKIVEAATILRANTSYDEAYTIVDMVKSINDKKGCCWHYTNIFTTILNKNGIYAESVSGLCAGNSHSWVRAKFDDKWHYIDISAFVETGDLTFLDLDYQYYMDIYKTQRRIESK